MFFLILVTCFCANVWNYPVDAFIQVKGAVNLLHAETCEISLLKDSAVVISNIDKNMEHDKK